MTKGAPPRAKPVRAVAKRPTGIQGFDEITGGGLPKGRPTLVCGGPGCGKTLFATEFLVRGATEFGEPGVLVTFEERAEDIADNVASLGFDIDGLVAAGQLYVDHVHIEPAEIEISGDYDLEGLFVRIGHAVTRVGAKRIVLDTPEALFSGFANEGLLRAELRRLFRWLKDHDLTAVITAEKGETSLSRYGLEEYVSDCVIALDHRVDGQISTRRLRVVKYRGSSHGTNEYPFLIDETGFAVVPITSAGLTYEATEERVSTGVKGLDEMLGGQGVYRGSAVLISGTAGTGKTLTCAHFAKAQADRGERTLFFTFEESPELIVRNARVIGVDLAPAVANDLIRFHAARPTLYGLEGHLARMMRDLRAFRPQTAIIDPLTALVGAASAADVQALATRLFDWLKANQITALLTSLTASGSVGSLENTLVGISSMVDAWILLRDIELNGERNRGVYVLKARGIAHSNQIREFQITSTGIQLVDAYLGPEGVLTGSARLAQRARAAATAAEQAATLERQRRRAAHKQTVIEAQIAALRAELDVEKAELGSLLVDEQNRQDRTTSAEREMARSRHTDGATASEPTAAVQGRSRRGSNGHTSTPPKPGGRLAR